MMATMITDSVEFKFIRDIASLNPLYLERQFQGLTLGVGLWYGCAEKLSVREMRLACLRQAMTQMSCDDHERQLWLLAGDAFVQQGSRVRCHHGFWKWLAHREQIHFTSQERLERTHESSEGFRCFGAVMVTISELAEIDATMRVRQAALLVAESGNARALAEIAVGSPALFDGYGAPYGLPSLLKGDIAAAVLGVCSPPGDPEPEVIVIGAPQHLARFLR